MPGASNKSGKIQEMSQISPRQLAVRSDDHVSPPAWYELPPDEALALLATSREGLDQAESGRRLKSPASADGVPGKGAKPKRTPLLTECQTGCGLNPA